MRKAELATLAALGPGGLVCGVDEAGRGPLAGLVVAACCHVPLDVHIDGIRDSKDITDEDERERIFEQLTTHPRVRFAVHVNSHTRIDEINILQVRAGISSPSNLDIAAAALRASHHLPSANILMFSHRYRPLLNQ
jgi:ribonuclease HII